MHVIWARGQEPNMYVHSPKSGLEKGPKSVPDFYRPDEVKYHGKRDQRGITSLNFFGKFPPNFNLNTEKITLLRPQKALRKSMRH